MRNSVPALACLAWLAWAPLVGAQPRGMAPDDGATRATRSMPQPTSFENRLSMGVADRLLASDDVDDWLTAIERLGAWGRREAVDRVLRALDAGNRVSRDPRVRITGVRALRGFAAREPVMKFLVRTLSEDADTSALATFVRQSAALALAASQDVRAQESLLDALEESPRTAELVGHALRAYPPISFAAWSKRPHLSAEQCALLGRLGDLRAIGVLRGALVRGDREPAAATKDGPAPSSANEQQAIRVAAARALASLGDEEQVPVARSWSTSEDPALQLAGAEILLASRARDALPAVSRLLRSPELRSRALAMLASVGADDPALAPVLGELASADDATSARVSALLGVLQGGVGVPLLEQRLGDPLAGWDTGFALATSPFGQAEQVIARALREPVRRRLAARAGSVRAVSSGAKADGLMAGLQELARSGDSADRATGGWGLALLGSFSSDALASSRDLPVVRAVARAALVRGGELARACTARLAHESDVTTRQALAIVLARGADLASPVATGQLFAWAESGEALAPLAALALGTRDEPFNQARLDALLAHRDPDIRAHAAWGLVSSSSPTAAARLVRSLRFEAEPAVRRAIVQALSLRKEPQRWQGLRWAAELDPDPVTREAARRAFRGEGGTPVGSLGAGCAGNESSGGPCGTVWLRLRTSSGSEPALDTGRTAAVERVVAERVAVFHDGTGLALPVVSDPDGALLLVGVSPGAGSFDLASSALWDDAPQDDTRRPSQRDLGR